MEFNAWEVGLAVRLAVRLAGSWQHDDVMIAPPAYEPWQFMLFLTQAHCSQAGAGSRKIGLVDQNVQVAGDFHIGGIQKAFAQNRAFEGHSTDSLRVERGEDRLQLAQAAVVRGEMRRYDSAYPY